MIIELPDGGHIHVEEIAGYLILGLRERIAEVERERAQLAGVVAEYQQVTDEYANAATQAAIERDAARAEVERLREALETVERWTRNDDPLREGMPKISLRGINDYLRAVLKGREK